MEKILDRFLRYVSVDTQSNEESESQPSTAKQLNLLRMLRDELEAMGVEATLDEYGYVMGRIPSNIDKEVPAVGFIAGGALMGVVSAILRFANVDLFLTEWNAQYGEAIAIIPFVALIAYMIYASMKTSKK